jgi:hypothetical protein
VHELFYSNTYSIVSFVCFLLIFKDYIQQHHPQVFMWQKEVDGCKHYGEEGEALMSE